MSTDVVICEKTSQAKDVQAAVGSRYGRILPAEGHLLQLQEPEDVNPEWKKWGTDLLRPPSGRYGLKPGVGGNKRSKLDAIRSALKGATRVWIATDCDREGQLIGQEILEYARFRGQVMRVMFTAQDPKSLQEAFAAAKPNTHYTALYDAAVARQQADQIYNLSLTRNATIALGGGGRGAIGVGRVKSPTLAIVCRRELEIQNFKKQDYFEVVADVQVAAGRFKMRHAPPPEKRITSRPAADTIRAAAEGWAGPLRVEVEDRRQGPPKLFDLPALQKVCASRKGWSADKTLDVAQELYDGDHKIITYPRAESPYLAENMIPQAAAIANVLRSTAPFSSIPIPAEPVIRKGKDGAFYDKGLEGVSHHAIIPNANTIGDLANILPKLSADQRFMFEIIARQFAAAIMPDFLYRQTTVTADVKGSTFRASGRVPTKLGWRAALKAEDDKADQAEDGDDKAEEDEDSLLPAMKNGERGSYSNARIEAKETKPPPRFNEGTLIIRMKEAWREIPAGPLQDRLMEAKGIGTPATRAEVIKGLKAQGFLEIKQRKIIPTARGMALYEALIQTDPAITDPAQTAVWECLLDEVTTGKRKADDVIDKICSDATRIIDRIKTRSASAPAGGAAPGGLPPRSNSPSPPMKRFVEDVAKRKGIKPPAGYAKSADLCRAFLDEHAPKKDGPQATPGAPRQPSPPSEAQLAFANKLAASSGKTIPPEAMASGAALSAWIDKNKATGGPSRDASRPPGRGSGPPPTAQSRPSRPANAPPEGGTKLNIPFGNKDEALKLGAQYRGGGWYAPAGADLEPFRRKGWL